MRALPWTFVSALIWMMALLLRPMAAQEPRHVEIVNFDARLDHDAASKAREAFEHGDIVRIIGASEAEVVRLFGSRLGNLRSSIRVGHPLMRIPATQQAQIS
jgi:hypothetical protein